MSESVNLIVLGIILIPCVVILIFAMIYLYHVGKNEILALKESNAKTINKGKLHKIKCIVDSYEQGEPNEYTVLRINNIKDIINK